MKAAIVNAPGKTPINDDFDTPTAKSGEELILVRASALSNFSSSRASAWHYSSIASFPQAQAPMAPVFTQDGRRLYFAINEAPFGALAEFCPSVPGDASNSRILSTRSLRLPLQTPVCRPGPCSSNALILRR
jgi:hypothetical protein